MENNRIRTVVAVFPDAPGAVEAYNRLVAAGVPADHISAIARHGEAGISVDDQPTPAQGGTASDGPESQHQDPGAEVVKGAAKGSAIGGVAAGALGAIAGAAVFAIPGVGPGIGLGVWAATLGSAAAGATAGGLIGAFGKLWDERYHSAVDKGATLVGVEVDDQDEAHLAFDTLSRLDPDSLDQLDDGGELVHSA